jgi:hypothetical protein
MRPVAGRGPKIEGHIRLRINDLGGGRYLDTASDRSFNASLDPHPGVQETGCGTPRFNQDIEKVGANGAIELLDGLGETRTLRLALTKTSWLLR